MPQNSSVNNNLASEVGYGIPTGYTGTSIGDLMTYQHVHPDYQIRAPQWQKIRDCFEGEDRVKSRGKLYLPSRDNQENAEYIAYKDRAQFVNFVSRTVDSLTSSIFERKETLKLPLRMERLRRSTTPDGLSFRQLARWLVEEVLLVSRAGILLDLPKAETTTPEPTIRKPFPHGFS
jgi:hypothetical protein